MNTFNSHRKIATIAMAKAAGIKNKRKTEHFDVFAPKSATMAVFADVRLRIFQNICEFFRTF